MSECRKCKQHISEINDGRYLKRVNGFGVTGVWECAPACEYDQGNQATALLDALKDNEKL